MGCGEQCDCGCQQRPTLRLVVPRVTARSTCRTLTVIVPGPRWPLSQNPANRLAGVFERAETYNPMTAAGGRARLVRSEFERLFDEMADIDAGFSAARAWLRGSRTRIATPRSSCSRSEPRGRGARASARAAFEPADAPVPRDRSVYGFPGDGSFLEDLGQLKGVSLKGCLNGFPPPKVAVDRIGLWRDHLCRFSLGTTGGVWDLSAEVAPNVRASSVLSSDDALALLLPDWFDACQWAREELSWPVPDELMEWTNPPGLFWTDNHGMYGNALATAAYTLFAFADKAMGPPGVAPSPFPGGPAQLRGLLSSMQGVKAAGSSSHCRPMGDDITLELDVEGRLNVFRPDAGGAHASAAISVDGEYLYLAICEEWKLHCAVADYYFFWAHRLLARARFESNGLWFAFLAVLAAKAGLAELIEIGGEYVHELSHASVAPHCVAGSAKHPVFGGCMQFLADKTYKALMRGALGLPGACVSDRLDLSGAAPDERFAHGALNRPSVFNIARYDCCHADFECDRADDDGSANATFRAVLFGGVAAPGSVTITWTRPSECAPDARESGAVHWRFA